MIRNLHLKMQSIILLILVPALLLVTVMMGSLIYSGLYDIIMNGFDHKLRAISSVSGAFINGDDHSRIYLARQIRGLALDPKAKTLYGVDRATGFLVSIDTADGGATDIGPIGYSDIGDLAFDPLTHSLYGISAKKSQLVRIDPRSGTGKAIGSTDEAYSGLAFDPVQRVLIASGLYLARIDPKTAHAQHIGKIGFSAVTALALDLDTYTLYGNDAKTGQLISIDPKTGQGKAIRRIRPVRPADSETPMPQTLIPNYALEYNGKTDELFGSGDRLLTIDLRTVRATWEPFTFGFFNENAPLYLQYVEPMRRIRKSKEITFIYTQVMGEGTDITYVLDGQTDAESHSNIGATDNIPDTELAGAKTVMTQDRVHLTDIKQWKQWGVLKSAWAPIYDAKQNAVGMAGTDVDISIIRNKTGSALAKVGLVAVLCVLVSGFVAFTISRRLTRPIARVKDVAIQVASGQYTQRIAIHSPLELSKLANSFNTMSQTLETTVTGLTEESRSAEQKRRRQHLQRELVLATQDDDSLTLPENLGTIWLGNHPNCADSSGAVLVDGLLLVWLQAAASVTSSDALHAVKLRSDITDIMRRVLKQSRGDWDRLLPMIEDLYRDAVACFVLFDAAASTIKIHARQLVPAIMLNADGEKHAIDLASTPELIVQEGGALLLSSAHDFVASTFSPSLPDDVVTRVAIMLSPTEIMADLSRSAIGAEGFVTVMVGGSPSAGYDSLDSTLDAYLDLLGEDDKPAF